MIRKFWIENGNGDRVFLAAQTTKVFLNNPEGFGYSQTFESVQYSNRLRGTSTQDFPEISGEVVFYDTANKDKYRKYNDFVTFLSYEPLNLFYQIPTSPAQTYSAEVSVTSLDKNEVKPNGLLVCDLELQCLSRWKGQEETIQGTTTTYTIENNGHMPVGFEITINGTNMYSPYFTLEQNGEMYGEAKFNAQQLSRVYVDSNDGEQSVELKQGNSILANSLSYQDLSIANGSIYVTFVKLARGESTLTIGMASGTVTDVTIKFTPIYRSV